MADSFSGSRTARQRIPSAVMRFRLLWIATLALATAAWGAQLRQVAMVDVPGRPGFDEAVFANGMLVMSHEAAGTLDIFDPGKRRVIAQVEGLAAPHGLAVDARGFRVYVANSGGNNIAVISSKTWKTERTIAVEAAPYNLALSSDGRRLFLANWRNQSVSAVDLGGDKVATENLGGSPQTLVYDVSHRQLYATLQDTAEIVAIDPATLKVTSRYKLTASQPTGMVLDAAGRRLYVAVRHAVLALDADTGKEVARVAAPAGADSLWLDPSGGMLYVASGGGFINVMRTAGGLTSVDEIHTEVRGHSVAYDPARQLIYLPGGREGRSKLLILKNMSPAVNPNRPQPELANANSK